MDLFIKNDTLYIQHAGGVGFENMMLADRLGISCHVTHAS